MDEFTNVIKRDPQVRVKTKKMIDKYNRLSTNSQSKIGYDTLIQIVILEELMNKMCTVMVDIDIEIKLKFSRIKNLGSKNSQIS